MNRILLLIGFLFVASCTNEKEKLLPGNWQATEVLEEGEPLAVPVADIRFDFFEDGTYIYNSTLNYKEAGTYSIQSNLLYTLDTVNQASVEKAVRIELLTQDSLHLQMKEQGKSRLLKLVRETF